MIERGRADFSIGEELADFACIGIGKRDQGFLGATQVERCFMLAHRLLEALDAAVHVWVQEREESAEVFRIALVRRCCHQQKWSVICDRDSPSR